MPTFKYAALPALAVCLLGLAACSDEAVDAGADQPDQQPVAEETRAPLNLAGQYKAFLFGPDHTDASGARLTEAWQVLREDRANYHARDVRQDADESDPLFADPEARAQIETMVANGSLTDNAARKIVEDDVLVQVDVYTRDGEPARLDVFVY